jgi:flavodoxin
MNTLLVYYSRTGTTRKVGEHIAKLLDSEIEEIVDLTNRNGPIGYLAGGRDATLGKITSIRALEKKPSKYGMIIIGSPVWAWTMAPAIRSFVHQNKPFLKGKKFAFFCTMGGSGDKQLFEHLEALLEEKPIATLSLLTKEIAKDEYAEKIKEFVEKIKRSN